MAQQQRKPREQCDQCRFWSKGVHGMIPDWCGEYAEPMRGDELACASFEERDDE